MLEDLARFTLRRRWWILAGSALLAAAAALVARGLFERLSYPVYYDPAAESTLAAQRARELFGEGDPDIIALYRLKDAAALTPVIDRVSADPQVARLLSPRSLGGSRFVSPDGNSCFMVVSLRGSPREKLAALKRIEPLLALDGNRPLVGGLVPSGRALTTLAEQSLTRGERLALPLTALLLVVIFGSVVAAALPVVLGGLGILLALGALALLARLLPIDPFAINVVTILGLGATIDYALFLLTRYREELLIAGDDKAGRARALQRAVATAGRSVLFAGVTVATSLAGLLVFRQPFLRSVAVGGMAVVLLAAILALVVLPAALAALGRRFEAAPLPWRSRIRTNGSLRRWGRLAEAVIAHPRLVCVAVTALLLLFALPFHRLQPSRSDVRALPASEPARVAFDRLSSEFPDLSLTPSTLLVTLPDDLAEEAQLGALWDYSERLKKLPSVTRVESLLSFAQVRDRAGAEKLAPLVDQVELERTSERARALSAIVNGRNTVVRVVSSAPPDSPAGQALVRALRTAPPPPGARVQVYGQAAALQDFAAGLAGRAPLMLLAVGLAMFAVLFVAFRSVLLPLKAMLMTTLSLTASFGAIVYVFQDGRLQRLLHYQALGTIDASLPVVLFAVVFGLSMDYEVVILGRIRESWLRTGDNRHAVVEGVVRTGRVITGAALLMIVVFSAFAAAPVLFVKALGFGMALAVALDATVVRLLLVPSTMALLGRLNWWAPRLIPTGRRRDDEPLKTPL